jgi:hypothetical protein
VVQQCDGYEPSKSYKSSCANSGSSGKPEGHDDDKKVDKRVELVQKREEEDSLPILKGLSLSLKLQTTKLYCPLRYLDVFRNNTLTYNPLVRILPPVHPSSHLTGSSYSGESPPPGYGATIGESFTLKSNVLPPPQDGETPAQYIQAINSQWNTNFKVRNCW